jgi:hypothetical protein
MDQPDKAVQFCHKSLRIRQRTLGEQHLYVALSFVRLGKIFLRIDETFQSRQCFIDAKRVYLANGLTSADGRLQEVLALLNL